MIIGYDIPCKYCLLGGQYVWNVKSYFLGKIRKQIQNFKTGRHEFRLYIMKCQVLFFFKSLISLHASHNCIKSLETICSINMLGFNMSTLVGHFMLSPRERGNRDRRDSRGDERKETEEIKTFSLYPYMLQG